MYNRKRQRRQAAAVVVESLWNNNNNNSNITTAAAGARKSTAQPRPVLNIPPRGIGPIADPNENDVLCGRGGRINSHAGNVQFRDIIHSKKKEYLAPSTKKLEKAHIAAGIVNDIRTMDPPGRFLKEDRGTGLWFDIGDAKAIKKTGQALREDAPDIRPNIEGEGSPADDKKTDAAKSKADTVSSKANSPTISPRGQQARRGNAISGPQKNLQPVWPQQGNMQQMAVPDYQAQISMPPPFLPVPQVNNINNYSTRPQSQQPRFFQNQPQSQQGFETRNIPIQVSAQPKRPSFPNQLYSGAQNVSNKLALTSRKAMEALTQAGTSSQQQFAPYERPGRNTHPDELAFGRAFHDPEGHSIMSSDNTVSTISGLSEPASSNMMGSGIGTSSNLMNMSLKSSFSANNSLRLNSFRGGTTNRSYDPIAPMAMSGLSGYGGSIKSGFGGSLTRSNSFPDMSSVVEGENWKSMMESPGDSLLDDSALKSPGGRIGPRNSSGMSIGSLMDVQSNASSTQWLAATELSVPPMPDDKSYMSSAMMSADLDALDLASSERLNL